MEAWLNSVPEDHDDDDDTDTEVNEVSQQTLSEVCECVLQEEDEDEVSLSCTSDSDEEEEEEEDLDDTASIATSIAELTSGAFLLLPVLSFNLLPSCRDQHQAAVSGAAGALTAESANTTYSVRGEDDSATATDQGNRVRERQSAEGDW